MDISKVKMTRTEQGIVVTGAQYLPDGTIIPWSYNATQDVSSQPEVKQEAAYILSTFRKGVNTADVDVAFDYLDVMDERERQLIALGYRNQNPNKCRKVSKTIPKRIHNPITGKYYKLRQRTTKNGIAGKIKGLWSSKKVTK